ncbi:MAG: hypothetical protein AB7D51_00015 [Desulfovibrionaceae bacterium]
MTTDVKNKYLMVRTMFCLRGSIVVMLLLCSVPFAYADWKPEALEWERLGKSCYKETVWGLLKKDLELVVENGRDPLATVYVATIDLNDDGLEELFVTSGIQPFSGIEGAWIGLFTPDESGEWKEIYYLLITEYSPRVLPTNTNGFHDLVAWNSLVTYTDGAYRRTPGDVDPVVMLLGKEHSPENLLPHVWEQCCSGRE